MLYFTISSPWCYVTTLLFCSLRFNSRSWLHFSEKVVHGLFRSQMAFKSFQPYPSFHYHFIQGRTIRPTSFMKMANFQVAIASVQSMMRGTNTPVGHRFGRRNDDHIWYSVRKISDVNSQGVLVVVVCFETHFHLRISGWIDPFHGAREVEVKHTFLRRQSISLCRTPRHVCSKICNETIRAVPLDLWMCFMRGFFLEQQTESNHKVGTRTPGILSTSTLSISQNL